MQAGQKRSGYMQNLVDILDPFSGWPDVSIWINRGSYCGLMIEMKRENSGAILKDGSLSKGKHVQNQHQVHEFLIIKPAFYDFHILNSLFIITIF